MFRLHLQSSRHYTTIERSLLFIFAVPAPPRVSVLWSAGMGTGWVAVESAILPVKCLRVVENLLETQHRVYHHLYIDGVDHDVIAQVALEIYG